MSGTSVQKSSESGTESGSQLTDLDLRLAMLNTLIEEINQCEGVRCIVTPVFMAGDQVAGIVIYGCQAQGGKVIYGKGA